MSTMSGWNKLRHVHLGMCVIIASATFAVLVPGPDAGATTPPPTWEQLSPVTSPSARILASMAYDSGTGQLVLFGGNDNGDILGDTWTWNGTTWTKQSPATSPSDRYDAPMAYDTATGQLVLFGGTLATSPPESNDTWTWNGTTWAQQVPATSPPARVLASMAYDSGTGQLVLFDGLTSGGELNDTWAYLPVTAIPTVSAVSPNSGPVTGGTAITITGTGFPTGATVVIGQGSGAGAGAIAANQRQGGVFDSDHRRDRRGGQGRHVESFRHHDRGHQCGEPR